MSETGQITTDPFGPSTVLAGVGLLLGGWRWVRHGTLLWVLPGTVGYLPHLQHLPGPTASNEYAAGWGLSIALYVGRTTALFAPSMRARFSASDEGKA